MGPPLSEAGELVWVGIWCSISDVPVWASSPSPSQLQFDADESYGDTNPTTVGPISHTWRTKSTTVFNPMSRLKDGGEEGRLREQAARGQRFLSDQLKGRFPPPLAGEGRVAA
jgi:hypothetical protein